MPLNASRREFVSAFRKHLHVFRTVEPPHVNNTYKLILFYSIECGLKAMMLDKIKGNTFHDLLNHEPLGLNGGTDGHDIKRFLNFLNYPCRLNPLVCLSKKNNNAPPKEYNQIWRYGIGVETTREEQVVTELKEIVKWIEERLT